MKQTAWAALTANARVVRTGSMESIVNLVHHATRTLAKIRAVVSLEMTEVTPALAQAITTENPANSSLHAITTRATILEFVITSTMAVSPVHAKTTGKVQSATSTLP